MNLSNLSWCLNFPTTMRRSKRIVGDPRYDKMCASSVPYCFLLAVSLFAVTGAIKIQSITVPDTVNGNSSEPLLLDCVFELNNRSRGEDELRFLVVKWKLDNMLIYQWTRNKSYVNEKLKTKIVDEKRNFDIGRPSHIPLTILNRTIDLTGMYECQVSTLTSADIEEDSRQKFMHVYVPVEDVYLDGQVDEESNILEITCGAEGLYPKPEISLKADNVELKPTEIHISQNKEQLYDINATYQIELNWQKSFKNFNCSVIIPEVKLTYYKSKIFSKSGQSGVSNSSSLELEQEDEENGADPSRVLYNLNLVLTLFLALRSFASVIN